MSAANGLAIKTQGLEAADVDADADMPGSAATCSDLSPSSLFDEPFSLASLHPSTTATATTTAQHNASPAATCSTSQCATLQIQETTGSTPNAIASRAGPPIPGLYFDPALLIPDELASRVEQECIRTFFSSPGLPNQAMLFSRAPPTSSSSPAPTAETDHDAALPPFLHSLLQSVIHLLRPALPAHTHKLLFTPPVDGCARQAIVNLYAPGEGIAPHVDLPARFADGVVGVSLGASCAMRFARVDRGRRRSAGDDEQEEDEEEEEEEAYEAFLPPRSVYAFTGEARYAWTHGIPSRTEDWVECGAGGRGAGGGGEVVERVVRGTRVSVTFRWLLPGADVVGADTTSESN